MMGRISFSVFVASTFIVFMVSSSIFLLVSLTYDVGIHDIQTLIETPIMQQYRIRRTPRTNIQKKNSSSISFTATNDAGVVRQHQEQQLQNEETITTTTTTSSNHDNNSDPPYVCLFKVFPLSKTCNKILQIANVLELAHNNKTKLALTPDWTSFYEEWFDPRPDIVLNYTFKGYNRDEQCSMAHAGHSAQYIHDPRGSSKHKVEGAIEDTMLNPVLATLTPKLKYRNAAIQAVNQLYSNHTWVSVHRRSLERQCNARVEMRNIWCTATRHDNPNFCDIVYDDVVAMVNKEEEIQEKRDEQKQRHAKINKNNGNNNKTIVLFTDGQDKQRDSTFPIRDEQPFPVQLWMMTLSSIHIGNTASSVDYLIHHWRRGRQMRPSDCWPAF